MVEMSIDQIEAGLNHLATSPNVSRQELIDGLCGVMYAQKTLRLDSVRPVLERNELGVEGLSEISSRFFEVSAQFLFPGLDVRENHFARSFLDVALMAKSFELGERQAIAEGWGELASPDCVREIGGGQE